MLQGFVGRGGRAWRWAVVMAICAVLGPVSAGAQATGGDGPLRVLLLSGQNNHDWRTTSPRLVALFGGCGRFAPVEVLEDPGRMTPEYLARFRVIVSNWTPYPDTARTWPADVEQAFLQYLENGGGFVVVHAACCTFATWPEFQRVVGLTWQANQSGHGAYHTFRVEPGVPGHPIARGLTPFFTVDEPYHRLVALTDAPMEVVWRAFSATDQGGTGQYEPMLVCTRYGQGRCANLLLGHDARAMENAGFATLVLRAAEWAATGDVTLAPPADWPSTFARAATQGLDPEAALQAAARYTHGQPRDVLFCVEQLAGAVA